MASTAKVLQLRPKTLHFCNTATSRASISVHFFSSSATPEHDDSPSPQPTPPPDSRLQPSFSFSSFSDVKASLKASPPSSTHLQSQPRRKPFSFGPPISNQAHDIEQIRQNLSEYRSRSAPSRPSSPPSTASAPDSSRQTSLHELYLRDQASQGQESVRGASGAASTYSLHALHDTLKQVRASRVNQSQEGGNKLSRWSESFRTRPLDPAMQSPQQKMYGGSGPLPQSIFEREMNKNREVNSGNDAKNLTNILRTRKYSARDLGEKLRALRPEKRDTKDWFSLEELRERLEKLRQMEEEEKKSRPGSDFYQDLRDGFEALAAKTESEKSMFSFVLSVARQS